MKENKWINAAIPALLIHCSIGTVYCWSTFKDAIAAQIGMSTFSVGWAFSLAIFFLGISAAFMGNIVEKNIHKSSLISCIFFAVGLLGTGLVVTYLTGPLALILLFICYGCIMGIGLGVGYLTPIKTLMLWFKNNPGLATGISIAGFGLAKAIATPIMVALQAAVGIGGMFIILSIIYFILMFIGHLLLKKPKGWIEPQENINFNIKEILKDKTFLSIWFIFFINIHCGLMLISYEKQLLVTVFTGAILTIVPILTAIFNAGGRLGYSTLSDYLKNKSNIYLIIFTIGIIIALISIFTNLKIGIIIILLLLIINAGYGGGFSTLPTLLSSKFGMENISKIHGIALSAWAVAGLTGNNLSEIILNISNNNYLFILITIIILYGIGIAIYEKNLSRL